MDANASEAAVPGSGVGEAVADVVDARPLWDSIQENVLCSRCAYHLRGLIQPRCPECGLQFRWSDLFNARYRKSELLFEHQALRRPIRSFVRTIWYGLRPRRFWADVTLHDRIRTGPLGLYLISGPIVFMMIFHGLAEAVWWAIELVWLFLPDLWIGYLFDRVWDIQWQIEDFRVQVMSHSAIYPLFPLSVLLWPLLIFTFLISLRGTMARCRVRGAQMLRVAAYALTPALLVQAVVIIAFFCVIFGMVPGPPSPLVAVGLILTFVIIQVLVPAYYLQSGLRIYLGLPRSWPVAWTAVFVSFLALATACVFGLVCYAGGF